MKGGRIIGWACWLLLAGGVSIVPLVAQEDQAVAATDAPPAAETAETTDAAAEAAAPDPFADAISGEIEEPTNIEELKQVLSIYLPADNSAIKLLDAVSNHPIILEALRSQGEGLSDNLRGAAISAFLPLYLILIGVQFLAYFAGAFGASKIFAPRHATLLNGFIFAAIPTVLNLIGVALTLTQNLPLIFMGNAIIIIAIIIALIIATMYLYDVGLLTMLLFAVVGNLIAGVVMVIVTNILLASLTSQLLGSGVDTLAGVFAKEASPYVAEKVAGLQAEQQELKQQVQTEQEKLDGLKTQESDAQAEIKQLQAEVASKRQTPQLVYTAIGQLVDQNKIDAAIASYAEFAAKFPGHPLANKAKEQIEILESLKAENEAERKAKRAALVAEEKRQLEVFRQKLADRQVTLSDIRQAVLGKSRQEVIELLGQADETQANMLIYTDIQVFDPVRNRNRYFIINFLEGRVQGANYIR